MPSERQKSAVSLCLLVGICLQSHFAFWKIYVGSNNPKISIFHVTYDLGVNTKAFQRSQQQQQQQLHAALSAAGGNLISNLDSLELSKGGLVTSSVEQREFHFGVCSGQIFWQLAYMSPGRQRALNIWNCTRAPVLDLWLFILFFDLRVLPRPRCLLFLKQYTPASVLDKIGDSWISIIHDENHFMRQLALFQNKLVGLDILYRSTQLNRFEFFVCSLVCRCFLNFTILIPFQKFK